MKKSKNLSVKHKLTPDLRFIFMIHFEELFSSNPIFILRHTYKEYFKWFYSSGHIEYKMDEK